MLFIIVVGTHHELLIQRKPAESNHDDLNCMLYFVLNRVSLEKDIINQQRH